MTPVSIGCWDVKRCDWWNDGSADLGAQSRQRRQRLPLESAHGKLLAKGHEWCVLMGDDGLLSTQFLLRPLFLLSGNSLSVVYL